VNTLGPRRAVFAPEAGKLARLAVLALLCVLVTVVPPVAAEATPSAPVSTQATHAGSRQVTFLNLMAETVWVAASPGQAPLELGVTGWVLPPGGRETVTVPNHWNGRFWGRTGCHFSTAGVGHCQTGDCGGLFQCKGSGAIPATLAEYNLDAWNHLDFYDVSMVDGSNLPMYINSFGGRGKDPISLGGCSAKGCTKAVVCPRVLTVTAGGSVVGCLSACGRFGTDLYCCRGKYSSAAACSPRHWPVNYAAVFKRAEPYAYSYAFDDASSTFTCYGSCNYRITFGVTPKRR
jgi:hypothetical protein